jgi:hypothetical protein
MSLDPVRNFAKVEVSTGYDDVATSIELVASDGDKLPQPSTDGSFNLVWWDSTTYPDPADDPSKEIVRCTARSSDTLTITRAQESTAAAAHNTSGKTYKMILAITKKMMDDLSSATFITEDPTGAIDGVNADFVFTAEPKAIVISGPSYRKNKGWTWNAGTLTATLDFVPQVGSDVWGIM